ncbi:hypothetical protein [Legionella worsleiensis]|uniref:Uncharacterized protein n=1 Tax=Legionella worsleiensis TaxID=45076 RepID=A0A0W1A2Z0_9GAMM|nr:hypothetical protein [Legionella worsleiensis]KTD75762.1 hypothetical protein Lwor_2328 [Legionella worsleiensis]STY32779.1 Uncharacterised protein [Legionella worsleiensis]
MTSIINLLENSVSKYIKEMTQQATLTQKLSEELIGNKQSVLEWSKEMSRPIREFSEYFEKLRKNREEFIENISKQSDYSAGLIMNVLSPFLAKRGWFITGGEFSFKGLKALATAIQNTNDTDKNLADTQEKELENFFIDHITSLSKTYQEEILLTWPHRKKIIESAFKAHQESIYELSVPVFLSQSDGICEEIFGSYLFTDHNGKLYDVVENKINEVPNKSNLRKSFVQLLIIKNEMRTKTSDRDINKIIDPFYCPVNRHGVLHGLDVDYGNRANSLRCISLLSFLTTVKTYFD